MIQLDAADRAILLELQADDRPTYAEIGARVGLSAAAVHERVKKLERRGVIRGYAARIDPHQVGLGVTAFVSVILENSSNCRDIAPALADFQEVEDCHSVAGDVDLLLKVRAAGTQALEDLVYNLKRVPGVARTSTAVVLSTRFENRPLVPPEPRDD